MHRVRSSELTATIQGCTAQRPPESLADAQTEIEEQQTLPRMGALSSLQFFLKNGTVARYKIGWCHSREVNSLTMFMRLSPSKEEDHLCLSFSEPR